MPVKGQGFEQSYNAQAYVDQESLLIVECHLTRQSNDKQEVKPALAERAELRGNWVGLNIWLPTADIVVQR